jgi:hypothetical protein
MGGKTACKLPSRIYIVTTACNEMDDAMGRPPIGKVAMTGAERVRRYRAKHGVAKPVTKPVTKQVGTAAAAGLQAENATLKARIAELEAARGKEPLIDASTLPMSAQEKLETAKRQQMKRLGAEFEQLVANEVRRRIDEMVLPHWKEQIEQAKTLYERRRGAMDKETFNAIRRVLHPDSRKAISDKKLGEAFDTFMRLEKYLLNEKDSPTDWSPGLPSSLAEWDKMRTKPRKRSASKNPVGRR